MRPHGQKFGRTTLYNNDVRHKKCRGRAKSCPTTNVHTSTIFFVNLTGLRLVLKLQVTSFLVSIQYVWWRRRFCSFSCYNCDFKCCNCPPSSKKTPSSLSHSTECTKDFMEDFILDVVDFLSLEYSSGVGFKNFSQKRYLFRHRFYLMIVHF